MTETEEPFDNAEEYCFRMMVRYPVQLEPIERKDGTAIVKTSHIRGCRKNGYLIFKPGNLVKWGNAPHGSHEILRDIGLTIEY